MKREKKTSSSPFNNNNNSSESPTYRFLARSRDPATLSFSPCDASSSPSLSLHFPIQCLWRDTSQPTHRPSSLPRLGRLSCAGVRVHCGATSPRPPQQHCVTQSSVSRNIYSSRLETAPGTPGAPLQL